MLKRVLHLNHAGASPVENVVLERQMTHLKREQEIGGYAAASEASKELDCVYKRVADLLHAPRGGAEVALAESASAAWLRLFYSLTAQFTFGDVIYLSQTEYAANAVAAFQVAKRTGARVHLLPSDDHGRICIENARHMMDRDQQRSRRQLLCVVHMPTNSGLVNDVEALGKLAASRHIPYLLDACQSVGHWPLDVRRLGDQERVFVTFTGRKYLRAPRGTGALWAHLDGVRQLEPAFIDHWAAPWRIGNSASSSSSSSSSSHCYEPRSDAKRFELWESNVAGRLGLGIACRRAANDIGIDVIWQRIQAIASHCRDRLRAMPVPIQLPDDTLSSAELSGIVTFYVDGFDSAALVNALRADSVACSLSMPDSAHFDFAMRQMPPLVRISVHHCTEHQDIDAFIERLSLILTK